jgi:hypothetical protein
MADTSQNQLVVEIARDLVGQIAPHELPLFRATSAAYLRRAARSLKTHGARDEMLGFSTGTEPTFLTPIVLVVTHAVVEFVSTSIRASTTADHGKLLDEQVRIVFRQYRPPGSADQQPPALTPAQVAQARQLAFQKACQRNLAEARAETLADALAGSIVSTIS